SRDSAGSTPLARGRPGRGGRPEPIRARVVLGESYWGGGMSLLIGSMTIGTILSLLALGVFLSFRIFAFPDITAEGSITLGASVAATLLVGGYSSLVATLAAFGAGMLAGATTGILHTKFNINGLLA